MNALLCGSIGALIEMYPVESITALHQLGRSTLVLDGSIGSDADSLDPFKWNSSALLGYAILFDPSPIKHLEYNLIIKYKI